MTDARFIGFSEDDLAVLRDARMEQLQGQLGELLSVMRALDRGDSEAEPADQNRLQAGFALDDLLDAALDLEAMFGFDVRQRVKEARERRAEEQDER